MTSYMKKWAEDTEAHVGTCTIFIMNSPIMLACVKATLHLCTEAGSSYYWMRKLFALTKLPIPDDIEKNMETRKHMKALMKKTTAAKIARARQNQRRLQESEQR